jgi:hypothetical protein
VRTSGLDLTAIDPIAVFSISIEEDAPEMIDLGVIVPQTYPSVQGSLTVESDDRSLRDLALAGEVPELALIPRAVGGSYNTTIETDGQFQLARVPPGFYKLHINGIPDGWYVSRASSGGRDILNDGMLVEGAVSPLDVRLAEGTGRIAGFVRNRDSQPVADSRVLLIPPVPLRGPFTQYPTTVSDEAGAWALERVPPGSYRVVALELLGLEAVGEEVQRGVYRYWQSPDFLRQYELRGELITVDPGARLTINPEAIPLVD